MKKAFAALAAVSMTLLAALPASAQQLTPGVWTGTITLPGDRPFTVTYEVGRVDGALAIAMTSILVQEVVRFQDVELSGDELTFWWEPGLRVDCTLTRTEGGGFEGPCTPGGGSLRRLVGLMTCSVGRPTMQTEHRGGGAPACLSSIRYGPYVTSMAGCSGRRPKWQRPSSSWTRASG